MEPTQRGLFISAFVVTRYCPAAGSLRRCHDEEVSIHGEGKIRFQVTDVDAATFKEGRGR
jgi:hypothetical protein